MGRTRRLDPRMPNGRNRRSAVIHWHRDEGPLATPSRPRHRCQASDFIH